MKLFPKKLLPIKKGVMRTPDSNLLEMKTIVWFKLCTKSTKKKKSQLQKNDQ